MRQQVNLYQLSLLEKRIPFSARVMAMTLAALFVCGLLAGVLAGWRTVRFQGEVTRLRQRQVEALQRIDANRRQYPQPVPDPVLAGKVEAMLAERQALLALLELLTVEQPGNRQGFSRHMEGLAREDLPTVWLRRIRFDDGGQELLLEGSATRPADVPLYLQRLTRQQDYAGREFERLRLQRSEQDPGTIDFLLQSAKQEKP